MSIFEIHYNAYGNCFIVADSFEQAIHKFNMWFERKFTTEVSPTLITQIKQLTGTVVE